MLSRGNTDAAERLRRAKTASTALQGERAARTSSSEPESTHHNARTAAFRAYRAKGAFEVLGGRYDGSHEGQKYRKLTRASKEGSHLARGRSLRIAKKKPQGNKAQPQRQKLKAKISLPRPFQTSPGVHPRTKQRSAESFLGDGDNQRQAHPARETDSQRDCRICLEKWELANPATAAAPHGLAGDEPQRPATPCPEAEQLEASTKMEKLRSMMSQPFQTPPKDEPSKLKKKKSQPAKGWNDGNVISAVPGPRQKTVARTFRKMSNTFRSLYPRPKPARPDGEACQIPDQHIEARRSHVLSDSTRRGMVGTEAHMDVPPAPGGFIQLPSTGEHILHNLDGTSYGDSRITSWADSTARNTIVRPSSAGDDAGGAPASSVPAKSSLGSRIPSLATTDSSRKPRIHRRRSSMLFSERHGLDSQRMYSALLKRIRAPKKRTNHADSSGMDQAALLEDDAPDSIALSDIAASKSTIRLVSQPSLEESPSDAAFVSDGIRRLQEGRSEYPSPSIYSFGMDGSNSPYNISMLALPATQQDDMGTAVVSSTRPVAVWNLDARSGSRNTSAPNTSGDWRTWTSRAMEPIKTPARYTDKELRSFSRMEKADNTTPLASASQPLEPASVERLNLAQERRQPYGARAVDSQPAPRYPSRIGGDGALPPRIKPLRVGSPRTEKFLNDIRKGPYGDPSRSPSPEEAKSTELDVDYPRYLQRDENTPPMGRRRVQDNLGRERGRKNGSESPAFL